MLMTIVEAVVRFCIPRDYSKEYVSVETYLDQYGIGVDAIIVSDESLSDAMQDCSDYISVQTYLEQHGLYADAIVVASIE